MCFNKKMSALQKDILRLAEEYGKVTPDIVSEHYDETYWTIKMNMYSLEKDGLLVRISETRLEFSTSSCDGVKPLFTNEQESIKNEN